MISCFFGLSFLSGAVCRCGRALCWPCPAGAPRAPRCAGSRRAASRPRGGTGSARGGTGSARSGTALPAARGVAGPQVEEILNAGINSPLPFLCAFCFGWFGLLLVCFFYLPEVILCCGAVLLLLTKSSTDLPCHLCFLTL